jgi:chaperonin GroEL
LYPLLVAAVKAPQFGVNRKSILGDLVILTGGMVFTNELDIKLKRTIPDLRGSTESITIMKEDTIVFSGKVSKDYIQAHCEQIMSIIADPMTSEFKFQEWLATLSGEEAVIKVGGSSEVEVGKRDRYAVEEGITQGGVTPKASLALSTHSPGTSNLPTNPDAKPDLGVTIICRALTHPVHMILTNTPKEASIIVGTLSTGTQTSSHGGAMRRRASTLI